MISNIDKMFIIFILFVFNKVLILSVKQYPSLTFCLPTFQLIISGQHIPDIF